MLKLYDSFLSVGIFAKHMKVEETFLKIFKFSERKDISF